MGRCSRHLWSASFLFVLWRTASQVLNISERRAKKTFVSSRIEGTQAFNRYESHPMDDVHQDGEVCAPSLLWGKEVDAMNYEIGCKEIKALLGGDIKFVGEGSSRAVYLTQYKGKPVAIKLLKGIFVEEGNLTMTQEQQWEQQQWQEDRRRQQWVEIVSMDAMKGKPDVVQLLGVCNHTIVTEAFSDNLEMSIARQADTPPIREIVTMCLDAARGLHALHDFPGAPIVHFDIKPSQFLLSDGRVKLSGRHVKLNDFNLAWFMSTKPDGSPCKFSSKRWFWNTPLQSPEFRLGKPMDEAVDIFGLAWVFYAMLNGGLPFGEDWYSQNRFMNITGGIPEFNSEWHSGFVEVVRDMFGEPWQRPSARQVVVRLEGILSELPEP